MNGRTIMVYRPNTIGIFIMTVMVFSYQKLLILAYYWSIGPPPMAFFTVAIVDEMMQLALTGPGMI